MLVGTVSGVGEVVLAFPSCEELNIIAKLLEDSVIESVPERFVAFAPTAVEPVPKLGVVGIPVTGDSAKNEEIEKLEVLPGIVPEGLALGGVGVGRLPLVQLVAAGLEVVLVSVVEVAASARLVAVEEAAADEGGVAEPWGVAMVGTDALIGPPSVLFATDDEGETIEILPLGKGRNVLNADISVSEEAMEVGLIQEYG
jgi:hypothetical protein